MLLQKQIISEILACTSALRVGGAIQIDDTVFVPLEFQTDLSTAISIIISAARAKWLGIGDECKRITAHNYSDARVIAGLDADRKVDFSIRDATQSEKSIIDILYQAELFPAAIIIEQPALFSTTSNNINKFKHESVEMLYLASRGPVSLEWVKNAELLVFHDLWKTHAALVIGKPDNKNPPLVRVHSSCFTGDILHSITCDCGHQLRESVMAMNEDGCGILIYLDQEGRGIGLANKMRAYDMQSKGLDTVDANRALGFGDDDRGFPIAAKMLDYLNINNIRIMTNNPRKISELEACGINVMERLPLHVAHEDKNKQYLATKMARLGHMGDSK